MAPLLDSMRRSPADAPASGDRPSGDLPHTHNSTRSMSRMLSSGGAIVRQCAWCLAVYDRETETWVNDQAITAKLPDASHGYCQHCHSVAERQAQGVYQNPRTVNGEVVDVLLMGNCWRRGTVLKRDGLADAYRLGDHEVIGGPRVIIRKVTR